ncbi:uncharacterized protein VTP21DRAFT_5762 [Calcarisporiella thermophila]|uniref:uncharacterized protein n=1 Tax=Calcarisporiella thermophila TaxID=911321 RepID=UPI003744798C
MTSNATHQSAHGVTNEKINEYTREVASRKSSSTTSDVVVMEEGKPSAAHGHERTASTWTAYVNIVCAVAGTGALGIPQAVEKSGWFGIGLLALAHIMTAYSGVILIKCLYYKGPEHRLSTFQDVGEHAFGKVGRYLTIVPNYIMLLGAPIIFLVLSGSNFNTLLTPLGVTIGYRAWVFIISGAVAVPYILTKTMKEVAILSLFGAFATVVTVVVVMTMSSIDFAKHVHEPKYLPINPSSLPIALSTFAFAYGGNVIYPHVESTMRRPEKWSMTYNIALITVSVLYFGIAIPAYLAYGGIVKNPVYDNILPGWPRTVAIVFITAHVLLAIPLFLTSFALEMEKLLRIDRQHRTARMEFFLRAILRIVIIAFCAVIAVVVRFFDSIMEILGSVAQGALIFVIPVLFYVKLYGWRKFSWLELAWCAFIIVVGLFSAVIGTIDAVRGLVTKIQAEGSGLN